MARLMKTLVFLGILCLGILSQCQARILQDVQNAYKSNATTANISTIMTLGGSCRLQDIVINQLEISKAGLPTWSVHITNSCTDEGCSMWKIVVNCGAFHSGMFVDPNVFRRLDAEKGTCIVNNGKSLASGGMVAFRYTEDFIQPMQVVSARVSCTF